MGAVSYTHLDVYKRQISGGAIAIHNSLSGINGMEWIKVIYGDVYKRQGWIPPRENRPSLPLTEIAKLLMDSTCLGREAMGRLRE